MISGIQSGDSQRWLGLVEMVGVMEAKVVLSHLQDRIELCISDVGVGFEPASAKGQFGLGLISMRERLRLVGGHPFSRIRAVPR